MALANSYPTHADAKAAIEALGFTPSRRFDRLWSKSSTLHDGRPTVAVVEIREQLVDAKWGQPNYFTVEFL